jgi:scyllo-inositol 2-dehydrogenase (NADP+)
VIRVALLGLGKMGISHESIINAHPDAELIAICDTAGYLVDTLGRYTSMRTYTDYRKLLANEQLDAVFVATPSRNHVEMVRAALESNLHVFCEKPFCLDATEGTRLATLAETKRRVNQVGYHYRFVGIFHELKRLLDLQVLGKLHNIRGEAYGPVVLRPRGSTWRVSKAEGGGCLYDYACHVMDLVQYLVGRPQSVSGTVLNSIFSRDVEDEVVSNLTYANGLTAEIAANWSDESVRKMSMKISVWGSNGKIVADRQELQIYIRDTTGLPGELRRGWNVRYTTDLTNEVWFYLRGEEYSAQVDHFFQAIKSGSTNTRSTFRSACDTDLLALAMIENAKLRGTPVMLDSVSHGKKHPRPGFWSSLRGVGMQDSTASG